MAWACGEPKENAGSHTSQDTSWCSCDALSSKREPRSMWPHSVTYALPWPLHPVALPAIGPYAHLYPPLSPTHTGTL